MPAVLEGILHGIEERCMLWSNPRLIPRNQALGRGECCTKVFANQNSEMDIAQGMIPKPIVAKNSSL
jgi:hypothetical protein